MRRLGRHKVWDLPGPALRPLPQRHARSRAPVPVSSSPPSPRPPAPQTKTCAKRQVFSFQGEDLGCLQVLILSDLPHCKEIFPPPPLILNLALKRVWPCSGRSR